MLHAAVVEGPVRLSKADVESRRVGDDGVRPRRRVLAHLLGHRHVCFSEGEQTASRHDGAFGGGYLHAGESHLASGPQQPGRHNERRHGYGPDQLDRETHWCQPILRQLADLGSGPGQQGGDGTTVQSLGRPRPASELGRQVPVRVETLEERICHPCTLEASQRRSFVPSAHVASLTHERAAVLSGWLW